MPAEQVFIDIYHKNHWSSEVSRSGTGSELIQTATLVEKLPDIFQEYGIKTVLDLPCGDWNWMKYVDLQEVQYHGGDIVKEIIASNRQKYLSDQVRFSQMNILADQIPQADLILCRDCLVHFSYRDIARALDNIHRSRSTYLLTTTFPEKSNTKIVTGAWRPINLAAPPFNLPAPLLEINENCTEGGNQYQDKTLALWELQGLSTSVDRMLSSLA